MHVWAPFVNVATREATVVPIVIGSMGTVHGCPNDKNLHDDLGEAGWWGEIVASPQRYVLANQTFRYLLPCTSIAS